MLIKSKKIYKITFIFMVLILMSCKKNITILELDNNSSYYQNEIKSIANIERSEAISKRVNCYFTDVYNLSEKYHNLNIKKINVQINDLNEITYFYNGSDNVCFINSKEEPDGSMFFKGFQEIGIYNLNNNNYKILHILNENYQASIVAYDENYIIWKEDKASNYWVSSINLFDIKSNINKEIYNFTINPDTNYNYSQNFEKILYKDNIIYFVDIKDIDPKLQVTQYELLSYDIKKCKISIIADMGREPVAFNNFSYMTYDETQRAAVFINDEKIITYIKNDSTILEYGSSENILCFTQNITSDILYSLKYTDQEMIKNIFPPAVENKQVILGSGLNYFDGESFYPILIQYPYLTQPLCDDNFIVCTQSSESPPFIYDIDNKLLLYVDILKSDVIYTSIITSRNIIFCDTNFDDNSVTYYIIDKVDLLRKY